MPTQQVVVPRVVLQIFNARIILLLYKSYYNTIKHENYFTEVKKVRDGSGIKVTGARVGTTPT